LERRGSISIVLTGNGSNVLSAITFFNSSIAVKHFTQDELDAIGIFQRLGYSRKVSEQCILDASSKGASGIHELVRMAFRKPIPTQPALILNKKARPAISHSAQRKLTEELPIIPPQKVAYKEAVRHFDWLDTALYYTVRLLGVTIAITVIMRLTVDEHHPLSFWIGAVKWLWQNGWASLPLIGVIVLYCISTRFRGIVNRTCINALIWTTYVLISVTGLLIAYRAWLLPLMGH